MTTLSLLCDSLQHTTLLRPSSARRCERLLKRSNRLIVSIGFISRALQRVAFSFKVSIGSKYAHTQNRQTKCNRIINLPIIEMWLNAAADSVYCVFENKKEIKSSHFKSRITVLILFSIYFFLFSRCSPRRLRSPSTSLFSARLGWTDDIDFDLNGDLTNNSYLNKYVFFKEFSPIVYLSYRDFNLFFSQIWFAFASKIMHFMLTCFVFFSDSFLSLSSALTVLKQEIPSPFGNDQGKKINKGSPMSKDQVDDIAHIEQATGNGTNKNGTTTSAATANASNNNTANTVGAVSNANNMACHLNGNSNSSASNDLVNCLDGVGQTQSPPTDPNDDRNDSNSLSRLPIECKYFVAIHFAHRSCFSNEIVLFNALQKQSTARQRRINPLKNPSKIINISFS